MTKHRDAVALRDFTHADDSFAEGDLIPSMHAGQFADWSALGVDLVCAATDAEVAKAKGKPASEPAAAKPKARAKRAPSKVTAPASEPVAPNPVAASAAG